MEHAVCDKKGRLYLRRSLRSRYGEKFIVIEAPGELIFLPMPRDPVGDLAELGQSLKNYSIQDLKTLIEQGAAEEAVRGLRRH